MNALYAVLLVIGTACLLLLGPLWAHALFSCWAWLERKFDL